MSGQLPSRTRVLDNVAKFTSLIPTYAHHSRLHVLMEYAAEGTIAPLVGMRDGNF